MQGSGVRKASSLNNPICSYDVFLSFRGENTRTSFTDHLYVALVNAGFRTFRDNEELRRGENIKSEIQKAIVESRISVVVFSKDYASSRWCRDELVQIMERKRAARQSVLPVFYDISPSQVRDWSLDFAESFARHEMLCGERMDMQRRWKVAVKEAADLAGMVLGNRNESLFVQEIVKAIRKTLNRRMLHVTPYLVGRETLVNDIGLWLQDGTDDVGIATIFGMGGVGKTTVAKTVYNLNYDKFEESCFIANIRETSAEFGGLIHLQRQLLSQLLKNKDIDIWNIDEGVMKIKAAVSSRRILIVLDDLDNLKQFYALIGMREWYSPGSKIIITSRYEKLLNTSVISKKFEVKEIGLGKSIELLSWHAFGQCYTDHVYTECCKKITEGCGGLPLALEVIGSSLSGNVLEEWESAIQKMDEIMNSDVYEILRIGYDSLQDDHDKSLFLDIACFFIGMEKDYVVTILKGCGFHTEIGFRNLTNRCLLFVDGANKIRMHQLLRDMGREIIRRESPEYPGKRTRLWHGKDTLNVLREKTGTESVRGLCLNMEVLKDFQGREKAKVTTGKRQHVEDSCGHKRRRLSVFSWQTVKIAVECLFHQSNDKELRTDAFKTMKRLKLLQIDYVELEGDFKDFPRSLVWLSWHGFPLESIPEGLPSANLVTLEMRNSKLKHDWKSGKFLGELKTLNLSHCHGLVKTPDFLGLPSLERLMLKGCINLVEVDDSIMYLKKLRFLDLGGCKNLSKLSGKVGSLESLEELVLSNCSKLKELPVELGQMDSLRVLRVDMIDMDQSEFPFCRLRKLDISLPPSWYLILSTWLRVMKISRPIGFPMAWALSLLAKLKISYSNLSGDTAAVDFSQMHSLEVLDLSGNKVHKLPKNLCNLRNLWYLAVNRCSRLQFLPRLPRSLKRLDAIDCVSLRSIENMPNISEGLNFSLTGCQELVEIQGLLLLKQMTAADMEIINNLGLFKSEHIEGHEFEMRSSFSFTLRKGPLQVLHEDGISSFFLPGNGIPSWYRYRGKSSISFYVPQSYGCKVSGLNVCIVFEGPSPYMQSGTTVLPRSFPRVFVVIKIKGHTLFYMPSFSGYQYMPSISGYQRQGQDLLWLSHWKLDNNVLKEGDHIVLFNLRMKGPHLGYNIKECGVDVVYKAEKEDNELDGMKCNTWGLPLLVESDNNCYFKGRLVGVATHDVIRSEEYFCDLARKLIGQDATESRFCSPGLDSPW